MSKITSTKGIGNNGNNTNSLKMCLPFDQSLFCLRTINQLKLRAAKRLKIPFGQVGLNWMIPKGIETDKNNPIIPEITLSLLSTFKNGKYLSGSEPLANSDKLMAIKSQQIDVQLYLVPFDLLSLYPLPLPQLAMGLKKDSHIPKK